MANVTLKVNGMSCGHCVNAVEGALKDIGAKGTVNLAQGTVDIQYEESNVTAADLKEAIEEQGYDVE